VAPASSATTTNPASQPSHAFDDGAAGSGAIAAGAATVTGGSVTDMARLP
jgi:hypothetical protein